MIRQWNNELRCFEPLDDNFALMLNINKARNVKNLCIRIGSFSIMGAVLCTTDYICTNSFTSGLTATAFGTIAFGCSIHGLYNYYKEKEYIKKIEKKK